MLPDEMRPERLILFEDIIHCSAKYDKDSILRVKDVLRTSLDLYCTDKMDENELVDLNSKLDHQLYEKNVKIT